MMTDVQVQDAGQKVHVQTKRTKWLIAALVVTMAVALMSLVALVIVAVTDEEAVVTKTETVTNTRVVPLRTPTAGEIKSARAMKDEMSLAVSQQQPIQVADPQTGLTPGQLADALRWQGKASALGIQPQIGGFKAAQGDTKNDLHQQTQGLTDEGLKGDSKNDIP
jgi:hypothetical protein